MRHEYTETDTHPACTCGQTFTTATEQWGHQMTEENR